MDGTVDRIARWKSTSCTPQQKQLFGGMFIDDCTGDPNAPEWNWGVETLVYCFAIGASRTMPQDLVDDMGRFAEYKKARCICWFATLFLYYMCITLVNYLVLLFNSTLFMLPLVNDANMIRGIPCKRNTHIEPPDVLDLYHTIFLGITSIVFTDGGAGPLLAC